MANVPTSKYSVYCDTFDKELSAQLHQTDAGETKALLSLDGEVSLYREDVDQLVHYLQGVRKLVQSRDAGYK